jgi:hypothetical protein
LTGEARVLATSALGAKPRAGENAAMTDHPPAPKPDREERLKQALRANLRRRKAAEGTGAEKSADQPR